jgi:hypothetical protein
VLQPCRTPGQGIREKGDTWDTCPEALSHRIPTVFAGHAGFRDTRDIWDTFCPHHAPGARRLRPTSRTAFLTFVGPGRARTSWAAGQVLSGTLPVGATLPGF